MAIVPQGPVVDAGPLLRRPRRRDAPRGRTADPGRGLFPRSLSGHQRAISACSSIDGGYEQMSLWDESIWPAVLGFVDRTGQPGPRYWENGTFPPGKEDHPVVGVSLVRGLRLRPLGRQAAADRPRMGQGRLAGPCSPKAAKPVQRRVSLGRRDGPQAGQLWGSGVRRHGRRARPCPAGRASAACSSSSATSGNGPAATFGDWEPAGPQDRNRRCR